jgi:hypothetical protein
MLAGDSEIPGGGLERLMPQQHLDRPDIDACFQQVRRKAMAARCDIMLHLIDNR